MDLEQIMNQANMIDNSLDVVVKYCYHIKNLMTTMRTYLSQNGDTQALNKQLTQYIEYYDIVYKNIQSKYSYLADKMKNYVNQSRENARIAEAKVRALNTRINDMLSALQQAFN